MKKFFLLLRFLHYNRSKIFIGIIFYFLSIANCFSQSGWVEYPAITNRVLTDIYFVDAYTGWVIGDSSIYKTTNGGVSWVRQNYNYITSTSLKSVKFLNVNTGFVAGGHHSGYYDFYYQYIFKTTDGGNNWYNIYNVQGSANCFINNIFLIDENTMYITCEGIAGMWATTGGVFKSTNGGVNFNSCVSLGQSNSVVFVNANTGWATAYFAADYGGEKGYILKTTNSGLNWFELYKDSLQLATKFNKIQFLNANSGFAIGYRNSKTRFFKTTNGGLVWDTVSYNHTKYGCLFFIDANTGWIGGGWYPDSSCVSRTTNNGLNWTLQKKNYITLLSNLYFVNNLTGWAVKSNSGIILKTTTGGITFVSKISEKIPLEYKLLQNYPNPFNPSTIIRYKIPESENGKWKMENGLVTLKVFDVLGKEIATLVNEKQSPGEYEVPFSINQFSGYQLPSGIYFYTLRAGDYVETKKMLMIK